MIASKVTHQYLIEKFKLTVPKLLSDLHKGQCGRIGIIGGSKEYTGAPYYAGITALRSGADICYIVASKHAAPIIKSYSPEMIVFPYIDNPDFTDSELNNIITKMHSLVIGPGLGRSDDAWKIAKTALTFARHQNKLIILDADALFLIEGHIHLIDGYHNCILTPNAIEFQRLYNAILHEKYEETSDTSIDQQCTAVRNLASKLNKVTILKKGSVDVISDGDTVLHNQVEGSNRRCGGQGDMVSGTLGTFAYWASKGADKIPGLNPMLLAAYCTTTLIKTCSKVAFQQKHRSMLTTDMIETIPSVFFELFDS